LHDCHGRRTAPASNRLLVGVDVDAELLHVVERESNRTVVERAFNRLLADVQFERNLARIGRAADDLFFALGFGGGGIANALVGEAVIVGFGSGKSRRSGNQSDGGGGDERTKHGNFP